MKRFYSQTNFSTSADKFEFFYRLILLPEKLMTEK